MIAGVGIDIVDIARMKQALQRSPKIINKILTPQERKELDVICDGKTSCGDAKFVESLSARFAAKEATVKSLGLSLFAVGLHSIEIRKNDDVPYIDFPTQRTFIKRTISFTCSLTHSATSAAAVVIAEYND